MQTQCLLVVLAWAATAVAYSPDFSFPSAPLLTAPEEDVATLRATVSAGVSRLGWSMDAAVGNARPDVLLAPVCISAALALVMLGAAGQTEQDLEALLGFHNEVPLHREFGVLLQSLPGSASTLFLQSNASIQQTFLDNAASLYGSNIQTLDFQTNSHGALTTINSWVSERTGGQIPHFLTDDPSPATRLLVVSALYFNGAWERPFYKAATVRRPFYVHENEVLDFPLMALGGPLPYADVGALNCTVLGLPYEGREYVMYLALPSSPGSAALNDLRYALSPGVLHAMLDSAKEEEVIAVVPRMSLSARLSLRPAMQLLEVASLFDPAHANLSGIAEGMYADDVLHSVTVDVTETGTVASAATGVSLTKSGGKYKTFRADRPFLFFIRHEPSRLLLFWGTVVRPTPAAPGNSGLHRPRDHPGRKH